VKHILLILTTIFIIGCGNSDTENKDTPTTRCPSAQNIILDNDNFDPDWLVTLITAIGLDQNCEINLLGVMVNGTDTHGRSGLMYQSVLTYYGIQDRVPVGINHTLPMRTTPTDATAPYPKLDPEYKGQERDISEFENDGLYDYQRPDVTDLLCEILQNNEHIIYVTGGHLQNIHSLLLTDKCDGNELIRTKIDKFIFGTGYHKRTEGKPEMNFSQGEYRTTPASVSANFVFDSGISTNTPFRFPTDGYSWHKSLRIGDQYKENTHTESPMAFIYAVPRYGVWGDHGAGDSAAVFASIGYFSDYMTPENQVCINLNKTNAIIKIENGSCNHYITNITNGNFTSAMANKINQLMNQPSLK